MRFGANEPDGAPESGLLAWLEGTKVRLPLKAVDCKFIVCGLVAQVEIDQSYQYSGECAVDCLYSFPLPFGASVYRCEIDLGGRAIRAKVEPGERAREIYAEQKANGFRAALVECQRRNFFTLHLGNLQPGDKVVVRFAYFQQLAQIGEEVSLQIPFCPGVRYAPGERLLRDLLGRGTSDDTDQVPDASLISPPRIDGVHPDAAHLSIQGRLGGDQISEANISSPTHPVLVIPKPGEVKVQMASRDALPDRDFVLRWIHPPRTQSENQGWAYRSGEEIYALVQFRGPEAPANDPQTEQDVYFLLDRSGSMEGLNWEKACQALQGFVELPGDNDRVWITTFESQFQDFAEVPVTAAALRNSGVGKRLASLGTGGGTEILPALKHLLEKLAQHSQARPATVIFISDGQVGNEEAILGLLRNYPEVVLHAVGIDTAVNDCLLVRLASQQRGQCWLRTPNDDMVGTVAGLADFMMNPVLTGVELNEAWESAGPLQSRIFANQVFTLSLKGRGSEIPPVLLRGTIAEGQTISLEHSFGADYSDCEALKLLWVREKIASLQATGEGAQAIALAVANNLICEGTSFVAWNEAEQVEVAAQVLYQPSLNPKIYGSDRILNCYHECRRPGLMERAGLSKEEFTIQKAIAWLERRWSGKSSEEKRQDEQKPIEVKIDPEISLRACQEFAKMRISYHLWHKGVSSKHVYDLRAWRWTFRDLIDRRYQMLADILCCWADHGTDWERRISLLRSLNATLEGTRGRVRRNSRLREFILQNVQEAPYREDLSRLLPPEKEEPGPYSWI